MDYQSFQPNPPAPTPPQMPQETPPIQKTITPKFIGAIVLILVLGGVAYAGLWYWQKRTSEIVVPTFTPRADETANWQTYRSEQYGFEFEYPKDWKYELIEKRSDGYYIDKVYDENFTLNILSKSYEGIKPVKLFSAKLASGNVVNGNVYYWCNNLGCESEDFSKPRIILISLPGIGLAEDLDLEMSFSRNNEQEGVEIFKQILSTFKFIPVINKTLSLPGASLVSFDYPSEWTVSIKDKNNIELNGGNRVIKIFYKRDDRLAKFEGNQDYQKVMDEYINSFSGIAWGSIRSETGKWNGKSFEVLTGDKKEYHRVFFVGTLLVDLYNMILDDIYRNLADRFQYQGF